MILVNLNLFFIFYQVICSPPVSGDTTVHDLKRPVPLPTPNLSRPNINSQKVNVNFFSLVSVLYYLLGILKKLTMFAHFLFPA